MGLKASDLYTWSGKLGRGDYTLWGLLLFVVKYNVDRWIATWVFGLPWFPWNYLGLVRDNSPSWQWASQPSLAWSLAMSSLLFIAIGVALTMRRLRDIAWPRASVLFFFVPFLNLLFFAALCLIPGRDSANSSIAPVRASSFAPTNPWASGALAVFVTATVVVSLVAFSTLWLREYGPGLFVGTPFICGLFAALIHGWGKPRSWRASVGVSLAAITIAGGIIFALAWEGAVCLLMAAPVAYPLAFLGGLAGHAIQSELWQLRRGGTKVSVTVLGLLPLFMVFEANEPRTPPLIEARSSDIISAPPEIVWQQVIAFSELPPPHENIFLAGIAYPVRARLFGRGVGAVRHCEFSTGPFVEPITVWEENRRLAFDVRSQPVPMREWSPYSEIHAPHLDGFFRSRRGQFLLTALPGNRTLLEGTTWYEQEIWPQSYWRLWSDYLIHSIHQRVLSHIKTESERS